MYGAIFLCAMLSRVAGGEALDGRTMKTDQLMNVIMDSGSIAVDKRTYLGSLTDVFRIGNVLRANKGLSHGNITHFLGTASTKAYIAVVQDRLGADRIMVTKKGSGRYVKTFANLHILIYAAAYLSRELYFEIVDTFINGNILTWLDVSAESDCCSPADHLSACQPWRGGVGECVAMNSVIERYLLEPRASSNRQVYIEVERIIRERVHGADAKVDAWNSATADQLQARRAMESFVVTALRAELITSTLQLYSLLAKDIF